MPQYLIRFSYTPETWAKMIDNPGDRTEPVRKLLGELGGTLHGYWFSFGEQDGYVLTEVPDNVSAAAISVKVASSGALESVETTVLITMEEMLEACRRASSLEYSPPGK